jgi:hypothetical protein
MWNGMVVEVEALTKIDEGWKQRQGVDPLESSLS